MRWLVWVWAVVAAVKVVCCQREENGEMLETIRWVRGEPYSFSALHFNDTHFVHSDPDTQIAVPSVLGVPLLFHRSHRYDIKKLGKAHDRFKKKRTTHGKQKGSQLPSKNAVLEPAQERVVRNLVQTPCLDRILICALILINAS